MHKYISFFAIFLSFSYCLAQEHSKQFSPSYLAGVVKKFNSQALEGVKIGLMLDTSSYVYTSPNGAFQLNYASSDLDSTSLLGISIQKEGFIPLEEFINPSDSSILFFLHQEQSFKIILECEVFELNTKMPLGGATINITEELPNGIQRLVASHSLSEDDNKTTFNLLADSDYIIQASKSSYKTFEGLKLSTKGAISAETFLAKILLKLEE